MRWQREVGCVRRFATLTPRALTIGHVEPSAPQTELRARCSLHEFVEGDYQDTFVEYFGAAELASALAFARRLVRR